MTFTEYTAKTIFNKRGKPSLLRIDAGSQGRIVFSVAAVSLLGLKEGCRLAFRTYQGDKGIIYFYEQATGIPLKKAAIKSNGISLAIYCRPLAEKILQHFEFTISKQKSFDITADQELLPGTKCKAWFILKSKIHIPIKRK
jgi:hypothetical protein